MTTQCNQVATAPAGSAIVVTAIHVDIIMTGSDSPELLLVPNSCPVGLVALRWLTSTSVGQGVTDSSYDFNFPSGLAISAGHSLNLTISGAPDFNTMVVSATGYTVAASQCTTTKCLLL